jgi:hypothetical protein
MELNHERADRGVVILRRGPHHIREGLIVLAIKAIDEELLLLIGERLRAF